MKLPKPYREATEIVADSGIEGTGETITALVDDIAEAIQTSHDVGYRKGLVKIRKYLSENQGVMVEEILGELDTLIGDAEVDA
jgi:flagellar biosynthesis/type III secretory pathway protein FliH